ncbi:hypothetical protein [Halobacillus sp. H74]|uniref:hypothetical protein n=1 Tax=Halobacillus sp. H74 TaxID=3457436 RepID=UPI003FCD741B
MMVTVHPCFHWIGYHISTGLLQEGVEVVGIDPIIDERSDLLYMYVGRNSNFQHFFRKEEKENHVQQKDDEVMIEFVEDCILIKRNDRDKELVKLPPLYGEWMNFERLGIGDKESLQQWVEEHEAVYIEDFLKELLPIVLRDEGFYWTATEQGESVLKERLEEIWRCQRLLAEA